MKPNVQWEKGQRNTYLVRKISRYLPLLLICLGMVFQSEIIAQVVIHPGEDIIDVILNNPNETTFHIEADITTPTIYTINQPIFVNRNITLVGVPNSSSPSGSILPIDVVIAGNNTLTGSIRNGDFEEGMANWNVDVNPPDPDEPGYSIIEENTKALSPTHVALFKGIDENLITDQISQDFQFTENPIGGDPFILAGYPEVWQDITFPKISQVVDILRSQPIDFPKGMEPTGLSYVENSLPLSTKLPMELPNLVSAHLRFEIMRSNDPVEPEDIIEIYVEMLNRSVLFSIPLSGIPNPMNWMTWNINITDLIQQYNPDDIPDVHIKISKLGTGENTVYLDDFRVFLDLDLVTLEIPIVCGDFNTICPTPWNGDGNWSIVPDPQGLPADRCLALGPSLSVSREVWVEMYIKTRVLSGKNTDVLKVYFDGMILPVQMFVEDTIGNFIPITEYNPNAIPNSGYYNRVLVQVPSGLTNDGAKHIINIQSEVSPCAIAPDSPDFNTTTFDIDDIRFLVGPLNDLRTPEGGLTVPNGDFESGNNGTWIFTTNPVIPERTIDKVIKSEGGHNAPFCAELGGIPPAKLSFYVKPVNVDGTADFFKVWLGNDESNVAKIVYDTRILGMPPEGNWTKIERWLVPLLLEEAENSFSLHIKSRIVSTSPGSYILFDDFCVSPYGGLGIVINPYDVCLDNAVDNPSFETFPDSAWNKNATATLMGPIHCYDTVYPQDCILPEPPKTGKYALLFGAVNPMPVLSFWLKILDATSNSNSELEILIDGNVIKTISANDTSYWNNYTQVILSTELMPYLDMEEHNLTMRVSVRECDIPPVRFLIDDVCIGYELLLPAIPIICLTNVLLDPGFESGLSTPWDAIPDKSQIIQGGPTGFIDSHTGAWYAQLRTPKPDIRTLWQTDISIPPSANKLQFYVWVEKGTMPEQTKLKVFWDDLSATPAWVKDAGSFEEGKWTLQEVALTSLSPTLHTLYFVYENCRVFDSSIIMIDDISIGRDRFPLIEIQNNGNLCIENLSLTRGSVGILDTDGRGRVYRCFLGPNLDTGIEVMSNGIMSVAQTVIHGNSGNGITNNGRLGVFQSTIRSNGGIGIYNRGNGITYVLASLIWGNAGGGLFADANSSLNIGWNLVHPDNITGETEVGPPITINPAHIQFVDSPWLGKLSTPIPARASLDAVLSSVPSIVKPELYLSSCSSNSYVDFENDVRDAINLQTSADEVPIVGTECMWAYCRVNPVVPRNVTGRERDIGIGNEFTVEVGVQGNCNLSNAELYLAPEEYVPLVTNAMDPLLQVNKLPAELKQPVVPIDTDLQRGRSEFNITQLFMTDADGQLFTTNGRARLYLRVNQILMGINLPEDFRVRFPVADSEFVIDTVPPRLKDEFYDSTSAGIVVQNNDVVSPPSGFAYPPNWGPAVLSPLAYSYGTISNQTEPTAQMFFNNLPTTNLSYILQSMYYDPYPEYNGSTRVVEVAGFVNNKPPVSASSVTSIIDLLTNGPIFPSFESYRALGCAFIVPMTDLTRVLSYSPNPVVEYSVSPDPEQTQYPQWQTALVRWYWSDLGFGQDWHIRMRFSVKDLSGNVLIENPIQQDALELWWMRDPVVEIVSAPQLGSWTNDPKIQWRLIRSVSNKPVNSDPCIPIFGIRIWSAIDPFNPDVSIWEVVDRFIGRWGWIINRESLDKNTPIVFSDGSIITLNDIINDKRYCGALLMATIIGADEAGNVQSVPNILLTNRFPYLGTVSGNYVPYCIWRNPCEFDIDTKLDVNSWWNRSTAMQDTWRMINYNFGERDFGSARRVPLPPLERACDYRVEIKLNTTMVLPSEGFTTGRRGFDIQIFEDSNLVAAGTVIMRYGDTTAEICIPTDFMFPGDASSIFDLNWYTAVPEFLNVPPDMCGLAIRDRLGDEGAPSAGYRKREVKYDFVVRAFVQDVATGALVTDSTPAKATVIIYPPVGGTERSITAPSQPKEEQRIKMFQRE